MRILFAGTPEFAAVALQHIIQAGHNVCGVLTQPDRPAGRGMKMQASAVKILALHHTIAVEQPRSLRLDGKFPQDALAAQKFLIAAQADVMVVAAYGLILPQWVLDTPRWGCLNIHASLLPRWRGAAPIHRAIEAGDTQTGVVIMQMDAGLDTGDMLLTQKIEIAPHDTTASLHDKLADIGGALIVQTLADTQHNKLVRTPQPVDGITYAHKIEKHEAALDWRLSAKQLAQRVRAFNPFPVASFHANGEVIKAWSAYAIANGDTDTEPTTNAPGTILSADDSGVRIACGEGVLCITELQKAGSKRLPVAEFLRGFDIKVGSVSEVTAP
ncbi:MAG: methionyl-tRNA formyltransferase [Burkholderiales bacterium]|nr:methionyl-tRNA formyltransferase [Burkholderiales bacterium]